MAAGLLLLAGAVSARAECKLGAVAVIPVTEQRHHFLMDADINNQPARLIVDTGAFATVINPDSARRFGIKYSSLDFDSEGIGGRRQLSHGIAARMRYGGLDADGMNIGVSELWRQEADAFGDGLFGMNLMAAYDVDLDFIGGHVVLFEADGACSKPTVALAPPLYIAKLEPITNNRQTTLEVEIEGHRIKAMLDTGAAESVLYRSAAIRLGVDLSPLHAPGHGVSQGIGPLPVASMRHVFKTVTIGDITFNNMPLTIINEVNEHANTREIGSLIAGGDNEAANQHQMLLGYEFLTKVHVWISHSSHRLVMQYPPQPSVLPH